MDDKGFIYARQCLHEPQALFLAYDGMPLVGRGPQVGYHPDQQPVAKGLGVLEKSYMVSVQQVEHTVSEDDTFAPATSSHSRPPRAGRHDHAMGTISARDA
jgi:hypothetical protein